MKVILIIIAIFGYQYFLENYIIPARYKDAKKNTIKLCKKLINERSILINIEELEKTVEVEKAIKRQKKRIKRIQNEIEWNKQFIEKFNDSEDIEEAEEDKEWC